MARSQLSLKQEYNSIPIHREASIQEENEELHETVESCGKEEADDIEDLIVGIQKKQKQSHQEICQVNFYHSAKQDLDDSNELQLQYQRFSELQNEEISCREDATMHRDHLDLSLNPSKQEPPTVYCDSLENVSNEEEKLNLTTEQSSKSLVANKMDRYLNNCTEDELVCMAETGFELRE